MLCQAVTPGADSLSILLGCPPPAVLEPDVTTPLPMGAHKFGIMFVIYLGSPPQVVPELELELECEAENVGTQYELRKLRYQRWAKGGVGAMGGEGGWGASTECAASGGRRRVLQGRTGVGRRGRGVGVLTGGRAVQAQGVPRRRPARRIGKKVKFTPMKNSQK